MAVWSKDTFQPKRHAMPLWATARRRPNVLVSIDLNLT
jgi:hypothetical protein